MNRGSRDQRTTIHHGVHTSTERAVPDASSPLSPAEQLAALAGDRLLTPQEVAILFGVSRQQAYSPRLKRALGAVAILGSVRYRLSRVQDALRHGVPDPVDADGVGGERDE